MFVSRAETRMTKLDLATPYIDGDEAGTSSTNEASWATHIAAGYRGSERHIRLAGPQPGDYPHLQALCAEPK